MQTETHFESNERQEDILPYDPDQLAYTCAYRDLGRIAGGSFAWHWHEEYEIDYVLSGSLYIDFGTSIRRFHYFSGSQNIASPYHSIGAADFERKNPAAYILQRDFFFQSFQCGTIWIL